MSTWIEIANHILNEEREKKEFIFRGRTYKYFIAGDKVSNIGFMIIWDIQSEKASWFSRIKIPDYISFVDINEMNIEENYYYPSGLKFEVV